MSCESPKHFKIVFEIKYSLKYFIYILFTCITGQVNRIVLNNLQTYKVVEDIWSYTIISIGRFQFQKTRNNWIFLNEQNNEKIQYSRKIKLYFLKWVSHLWSDLISQHYGVTGYILIIRKFFTSNKTHICSLQWSDYSKDQKYSIKLIPEQHFTYY